MSAWSTVRTDGKTSAARPTAHPDAVVLSLHSDWAIADVASFRRDAGAGLAAAGCCIVAVLGSPADAGTGAGAAVAQRSGGVSIQAPVRLPAATFGQTCFDSLLTLILNPGCFRLLSPPSGGDCVSHNGHYFLQYFTPTFATPQRIAGFGFISNDGATVFPSAGVVLIPSAMNRFPTVAELGLLQVHNVQAAHDTAAVVVDLRPFNLTVTSGVDVVVCLRFPEGGQLTNVVGVGPGIAVDETNPDQPCDFFTHDGGGSYNTNLASDPLDWGFELIFEPVSALTPLSWSALKGLYDPTPRAKLYRDP